MRVLFLNPSYGRGFCKTARWFARSRAREQRHPDYICTAIAVLEREGHVCRLIDAQAKDLGPDYIERELKAFNPDAVVINATTPSIDSDIMYARLCKEETPGGTTVIFIGPHVTAEPEDTLRRAGGTVDVIARREYDYTLREFASASDFRGIDGVSYIDGGAIHHNPDRPFIDDTDELPFPSWRHIDLRDYFAPAKRNPFITLISGRGCEGRCTFCLLPQTMYGRGYRPRSAGSVLDEIEYDLALFPGLKEIMFEDDTLTSRNYYGRLREICGGIIDRGIKISWACNARPDILDESLLRLMKKSGCRMLCVGFESGDEGILNNIKKGTNLTTMARFAELCARVGISVHGCFVIGAPGETPETVEATVRFATSIPVDTVQFSGLCPYPGTEFYAWCKENNFLVPREWKDWVNERKEQKCLLDYPGFSMDEMNKCIDRCLYRFYLRPGYIFSQITRRNSISDIRSRVRALFNFLDHLRSR